MKITLTARLLGSSCQQLSQIHWLTTNVAAQRRVKPQRYNIDSGSLYTTKGKKGKKGKINAYVNTPIVL